MGRIALFASGGVFAFGLAIGGMTDADKVIGFLDVSGSWDPSLAMVMLGAIAVHTAARRWIGARSRPLFAERFGVPAKRSVSLRLVGGAALFGAGWGLGGYCPGPGLVCAVSSIAQGGFGAFEDARAPIVFVATMSFGWWCAAVADRAIARRRAATLPTNRASAASRRA